MSEELRLWVVEGSAHFRTLAWARTAENAEDAVLASEYEDRWKRSAREIPIEVAVLIADYFCDTGPDDELWHFEDNEHPDPPTLAQAIEVLRERHATRKRAETRRDSGQGKLPLDGASEEWRPVVGFEGLYEVSDLGRVRSCCRRVVGSSGGGYQETGLLKPQRATKGVLQVCLYPRAAKSVLVQKCVHLLVLEAFLGSRPDGCCGRFLDGDRSNTRLDNLEWGPRPGRVIP